MVDQDLTTMGLLYLQVLVEVHVVVVEVEVVIHVLILVVVEITEDRVVVQVQMVEVVEHHHLGQEEMEEQMGQMVVVVDMVLEVVGEDTMVLEVKVVMDMLDYMYSIYPLNIRVR